MAAHLGRERLYVGGDFTKVNGGAPTRFRHLSRHRVTEVANWSRSGHNPPPILQLVGNFRRYGEEIPYNWERGTHRRRVRCDDERLVPAG